MADKMVNAAKDAAIRPAEEIVANPENNDPFGIVPEKAEQRDEDLLTILRNEHIYRKIRLAPKYEIVIQDLKTRHVMHARRMALMRTTGGSAATVDPQLTAYYEMVFGLSDCIIDGKPVGLPPIDSDPRSEDAIKAFSSAFDSRLETIGSWPAPLWNRALMALRMLIEYVDKISSPDKLVDF